MNAILRIIAAVFFIVTATVAHADELKLECRVIDTDGQPIRGVEVSVRTIAPVDPDTGETANDDTLNKLPSTGNDGVVSTGSLKPGISHVLEFSLAGFVPMCSRRSHIDDTGTVKLPDVTLRRLRTVEGTVVDADGHPLPDVTVSQAGDGPEWTTTQSAADGTFQLDGVPEGLALVFAECDGFWFTGKRAPTGNERLEFTLTPRSRSNPERCDVTLTAPAAPQDAAQNAGLVDELIDDIRKASQVGDQPVLYQSWRQLTELDDARATTLLTELDLQDDDRAGLLLAQVRHKMEKDFENGMASLMEYDNPQQRIATITHSLLPISTLNRDQKHTLLVCAVTDLYSIEEPWERVSTTSRLLKPLNDIGARHTVDQLVEEATTLLNQAGDEAYLHQGFGVLAEAMAAIDADRALTLLENASPMYSAWVASGIARQKPDKAAELLRNYEFSGVGGSMRGRWYILPIVCYRLATVDIDQSLSIAELSDGIVSEKARYSVYKPIAFGGSVVRQSGFSKLLEQATGTISQILPSNENAETNSIAILLKARIHGFIAQAISESDPKKAQDLIEHAVKSIMPLREGVRNKSGGHLYAPSLFMASLTSAAADIDPGLAAEICWRALALRVPMTGKDELERMLWDLQELDSMILLATLDQPLAVQMIHETATRSVKRSFDGTTVISSQAHLLKTLDPVFARHWIDSVCDRGAGDKTSPRLRASRMWRSSGWYSQHLNQMPLLRWAESRINSTLWMSGVVDNRD